MSDSNKTPGGDHIEELLSQLKGIFGHLSETDQEEAKQKISPPPASAKTSESSSWRAAEADPGSTPPPTPPSSMPSEVTEDLLAMDDSSLPDLVDFATPAPQSQSGKPGVPGPGPAAASDPSAYTPNEVIVPEGAYLVPAAIFYPVGKMPEAKMVIEKVERITPKFTKVAVVLNVQALAPYETKSDLKNTILTQTNDSPIKAVFFIVEKTLDEARRKALISELESKGIYFQEIPVQQIEKKALYTDMLLGMVFFFDSRKPATGESAA